MNVEDDIDDLLSDIEGESDFEDKGEGGSVLTGSQIGLTPDGSVDELLGEDIENEDNAYRGIYSAEARFAVRHIIHSFDINDLSF